MADETQERRTPEEFAKNYKTYGDGLSGAVAVSNINVFDKESGLSEAYDPSKKDEYPETARVFVNLAMKTLNTGERNAVYSIPVSWNVKWKTGDYVVAEIVDGWVQRLLPVTVLKSKEITRKDIDEAVEAVDTTPDTAQTVETPEVAETSEDPEKQPF